MIISKNYIFDPQPKDQTAGARVFELRDYLVMLADDVAEIFNVETREQYD